MSQKSKVILRTVTTIIVCFALIFAFMISAVRLFGVDIYGVLTGSMEPTYPVGSLIYVKKVDPSQLRVQDVITFSLTSKTVVTHRIVEIVPDETNPQLLRFRTQGDANNAPDAALVAPSNIIGKVVFGIPHLGNIANYVQHPPGTYVAIALSLLLIIIVFITDSATSTRKGKEEKRIRFPRLSAWLEKAGLLRPKADTNALPPQTAPYPGNPYPVQQPYIQQPLQYPIQQQYGQQPLQYPVQQPYIQQPPQYPVQQQYGQQPLQYPVPPQYAQPQLQHPAQQPYIQQPLQAPLQPPCIPQQPLQYVSQPQYAQPQQYPPQPLQYQQPPYDYPAQPARSLQSSPQQPPVRPQ